MVVELEYDLNQGRGKGNLYAIDLNQDSIREAPQYDVNGNQTNSLKAVGMLSFEI